MPKSLPVSEQAKAAIKLRERIKLGDGVLKAPNKWDDWLEFFFPRYVPAPFADRHIEMWEWFESILPDVRPLPFVAVWPRGGAKSSTAELGVVRLGARKARRYCWYVSETQDQADKHVDSIGSILENDLLAQYYPKLSSRALGKYGSSKGWRRSRLRTASGMTIDALGLDVAGRGAKIEDQRPDLIILDDIDDKYDSVGTTLKKQGIIANSILAAGSNDLAVLFVQNMIHPDSIASRLVDGRADILSDRILSGPFKAIDNLEYSQVGGKTTITAGTATWEGQDLTTCQMNINTWGLTSFLQEAQHEVDSVGGQWAHVEFQRMPWDKLPRFIKVVVWVDPAVTSTDNSDCQGICAGALGADLKKYMLFAWEGIDSPERALERAIEKGIELGAEHIGIETDQGGDTWQSVYKEACNNIRRARGDPHLKLPGLYYGADGKTGKKAGAGYGPKRERNDKMRASYERGEVIHAIGTHGALERALLRFPIKPLDLADATFWVWDDLENSGPTADELQRYGRGELHENDIDDDMIQYHMSTHGMTYDEAKADLLKEFARERTQ